MTLNDWLAAHGMSNAEFARFSGIGQRSLIMKYRRGRQTPAPENLVRIREATKGAVTANDFLDQRLGASAYPTPAKPPRKRAAAPAPAEPAAVKPRRKRTPAPPSAPLPDAAD